MALKKHLEVLDSPLNPVSIDNQLLSPAGKQQWFESLAPNQVKLKRTFSE